MYGYYFVRVRYVVCVIVVWVLWLGSVSVGVNRWLVGWVRVSVVLVVGVIFFVFGFFLYKYILVFSNNCLNDCWIFVWELIVCYGFYGGCKCLLL